MKPLDLLAPAALLYPDFRLRVIRAVRHFEEGKSFRLRLTMGMRSFKKQQELYDQGRLNPGPIVTQVKPGHTAHNYGIGADVATTVPKDPYLEKDHQGEAYWQQWGECAEAEGLVWGGRWARLVDKPHVQISYGMSTDDMLHLYQDGGIPAVWSAFDKRRGVDDSKLWVPVIAELRNAGFEVYTAVS